MDVSKPTRPSLSGYVESGKLLPWMWVDARMAAARSYWITTHARLFPSSRPVWGVWHSPFLWFSTGSAVGRNIARNARIQVNLESANEVVVIEGVATKLPEQHAIEWARTYNEKYNWDMPETTDDVWQVAPTRVLAWLCDSTGLDYGAGFSNSATEWRFEQQ